ncbi:MAG TPA: ATP-binding protein [Caulobacteraceae bacterium]|jgi:PAS domain S-box-containing protein
MTKAKAERPDIQGAAGPDDAGLLTQIANRIAAGDPMAQIFQSIIAGVECAGSGFLCSILLLKDARHLSLGAAPSLPEFYNAAIDGVEIGPDVGSCGTAAFLKQRVIVEDIATDPLWINFKDLAAQADLAACWSEPIIGAAGRVLGTFAIYQRRPGAPSQSDIATIAAAAHLVAITIERDETQGALAESEARANRAAASQQVSVRDLESFFAVSRDMLCIATMTGNFRRLNHAWKTVLGYDTDRLLGRNYLFLLHPDDLDATAAAVTQLGKTVDEITMTNRYRCSDGAYKPIEWRACLSGELLFCVGRDVTERMAIESEMKAARQDAEAANRAKSDFLANMSHEVRTPLNGVIGIVDALAQTSLSAAQAEMVQLIQSSGATLERLVSDILDLSKIEARRLELEIHEFDLGEALDGVIEVARIRADEKGIGFSILYGSTARGHFHGDSVRLKQVLDNLLSNAVKFTQSGQVSVAIDLIDASGEAQDEALTIVVSDTGVGFDPAMAATLFDRFSQADGTITRRFGGTGLGLSISKALVEMMGGTIQAASTPGEGSAFTVILPLPRSGILADYDRRKRSPAPSRAAGPGDSAPILADERPLRVLVAEDNLTNQKVVALILAPLGADLTIVENGAQAVEAFRSGDFDLVLMDMQMPVMDGLAATRALREIEQTAPWRRRTAIAMLSANAMAHHRQEAAAAGADLHIPKPVTARGLIEGVEQALSLGGTAKEASAAARAEGG